MRATFDNNLYVSAFLWAENRTAQILQAYVTLTMPLFYSPDTRLPSGYVAYASPLKQFVYDSGVSGAYVMNSVSGGQFTNYPLTRDSGMHIDYENGRVVLPSSFGTALTLTGTASVKQINLYTPNETEEQILTQNKYFLNPRYASPLNSGVPPYVYATPAMFLNSLDMHNEPYQFGGLVNSKATMSFTILAETNFQLTALLSMFRDCRYGYLPMVNLPDDPLDEWGDVKGGTGFNYQALVGTFGGPGNLIYIEDVRVSKVSDRVKMNPLQFAGIADVQLSYIRQTPVSSNIFV